MTTQLILHTPMPIMPLTTLVADMGVIIPDIRPDGRRCCFYGWGEAMDLTRSCLPHLLITAEDNMTLKWMAATLKAIGEQVVVTEYEDWSEVIGLMPILYDDAHQH